jgi:hypothetical protein
MTSETAKNIVEPTISAMPLRGTCCVAKRRLTGAGRTVSLPAFADRATA